jgi:hypothetical protein
MFGPNRKRETRHRPRIGEIGALALIGGMLMLGSFTAELFDDRLRARAREKLAGLIRNVCFSAQLLYELSLFLGHRIVVSIQRHRTLLLGPTNAVAL